MKCKTPTMAILTAGDVNLHIEISNKHYKLSMMYKANRIHHIEYLICEYFSDVKIIKEKRDCKYEAPIYQDKLYEIKKNLAWLSDYCTKKDKEVSLIPEAKTIKLME